MLENRSVPPNTLLSHVAYQNLPDAIAWLTKAFGFREQYRYGDPISGAQVLFGGAWLMLKAAKPNQASPAQLGFGTQSLTLFTDHVDSHYECAKSAGATILEEPHETVYGEWQYAAQDLEGHRWLFSRHARDLSPDEWGAVVTETRARIQLLPRPRLCYFEIPARNIDESARFYAEVFGWNIRHRGSNPPSFDDATGNISGAWVLDRPPNSEPGLLPYIWVDDVRSTLENAHSHGAEILGGPTPIHEESDCLIARFRDPAGNVIGLYQE